MSATAVTGGAGAAAAVEGAAPAHAFVPGSDTVPDWVIDAAIHGGASGDKHEPLSRGPHEGGKNCWSALDAAHFDLRGPTYLADSVKLPSIASAFRSVGVHAFKTSKPHHRAGHNIPALIEFLAAHPTQQFFLYNWLLPGSPCHNVVQVFVRHAGPDSVLDPLYQRFIDGDDEFRNSRFKFCCKLVHAPWLVTAAVSNLGGERPAIIGKKLTVTYARGANFFEVDVDVGSSKIASMVSGIVLRGAASIVVDLGFLLEGQAEEELPERMMGSVRFHNCDLSKVAYDLSGLF